MKPPDIISSTGAGVDSFSNKANTSTAGEAENSYRHLIERQRLSYQWVPRARLIKPCSFPLSSAPEEITPP